MPFGKTYAEIEELILRTALDTQMCRDIVRRAGLRPNMAAGIGVPVSVLSASWIIEPYTVIDSYLESVNDPYGILWDPADGFPDTLEFWPSGEPLYTTLCDLSGYVSMRNVVFIAPDTPNPPLNVRVEASLDGETWAAPTIHDSADWLYAGCNANLGNWPATAPDASGGAIVSAWQFLAPEYQVADVHLRWVFFVSPVSDESPYDISGGWGPLRFGYANVQVS